MKFIKNNFKKLLVLLLLVIAVVGLVNFNRTGQLTGYLRFKATKEFAIAKVIHPSSVKSTVLEIPLEISLNRNLVRPTNFNIEILEPNTPGIFEIVAERPTDNFKNYKYKLLKRGDLTTERLVIRISATESGILFGNRDRDYTIVNIDVRFPRVNTNISSLRINRGRSLPSDELISIVPEDRTNVRPLGVPERYYSKNESNTQINLALDNNAIAILHDSRNYIDEAASFKLYSEDEQVFVEINDVNHVDSPNVVNLSEQNVAFINTSDENRDYSIRFETVYEEDRPDKYLIELTSKSGPVNLGGGTGRRYLWNKLDTNEYELLKYFPSSYANQHRLRRFRTDSEDTYVNYNGYVEYNSSFYDCRSSNCEVPSTDTPEYYIKEIDNDNYSQEIYNYHPFVEEFELTEDNSEVYLIFKNTFNTSNDAQSRGSRFPQDEFDNRIFFHENNEISSLSFDKRFSVTGTDARMQFTNSEGNNIKDFININETIRISIPNSNKVYSIKNVVNLADDRSTTTFFLRIRSNDGPVNLAIKNSDNQNYNLRLSNTGGLRVVALSGENTNGIDNLKFTKKFEGLSTEYLGSYYFVEVPDYCSPVLTQVITNENFGFEGELKGDFDFNPFESPVTNYVRYGQHYSIRPLSSLNDLILFQITNEEDYQALDFGC
jgi:hypothetical protein